MLEKLKSIDIYGHPVGVQYKGNRTHNTLLGSLFTILTSTMVLLFAASRMIEII